jgi:hypothetical protein
MSGSPVNIKNPPAMIQYILTSVVKGVVDHGSRERVLLEIMGLVPNAAVGDSYGTISETPAKIKMRKRFWDTYADLMGKDSNPESIDYSNDDKLIMINLHHFNTKCLANSIKPFFLNNLKHALRASKDPLFLESNRAVWSPYLKKTVRCWVFEKNKDLTKLT